jgi:hypothetical protein
VKVFGKNQTHCAINSMADVQSAYVDGLHCSILKLNRLRTTEIAVGTLLTFAYESVLATLLRAPAWLFNELIFGVVNITLLQW